MTSILAFEPAINGKRFISQARAITADDVIVTESNNYTLTDTEYHAYGATASNNTSLTFKPEFIQEIIEALKLPLNDKGNFRQYNSSFSAFSDNWNPTELKRYDQTTSLALSYRKCRTEKTKRSSFEATINTLNERHASLKETLIAQAIAQMEKALTRFIEINNEGANDDISRIVLEGTISDKYVLENLSQEEQEQMKGAQAETESLSKQIEAMRKQQQQVSQNLATLRKKAAVTLLTNVLGDTGTEALEKIKTKEVIQKPTFLLG